MKNKVFIVIVTYNGMPWINKCLGSCEDYNIIVVDNNSSDTTVNYIIENFPKVKLLKQKENLGFGAANNIGISYALKKGADYLFLLNQDAYLETNTIETLINIHRENKEYGILSPIHLNGIGNKLDLNFSNYISTNKELQYDALKQSYSQVVYKVPFVNAAAWLIPKNTIETIGGFDPIFFHYGEDDNYCQRVLFHKLKIGVVPNTYIYHDREYRVKNQTISNKHKLVLKERYLKYRWANVNIEIDVEIKINKIKLIKLIIKLLLKLQIKKTNYYFKEFYLIKKITPEIKKSRKTNRTKGVHYISKG